MEITFTFDNPAFPDVNSWTISSSKDDNDPEAFALMIGALVKLTLLTQKNLWVSYKKADGDIAISMAPLQEVIGSDR